MKRWRTLLAAALAVLTLTGCGLAERAVDRAVDQAVQRATENLVEQATGIKVDTNEGAITFTSEDGETVTISGAGEEGRLVEGFPLPVHSRLTVDDSGRLTANGKTTYSASFAFEGDATELADYYEQLLQERGFEVARTDMEIDDDRVIYMAAESDTHSAIVSVQWSGESGEGTLTLLHSDK